MSSATDVVQTRSDKMPSNWGLWLRQIGAIFRMEIEKNFLSRRSLDLSAGVPAAVSVVDSGARSPARNEWRDFNQMSVIYSILYNG